MTPGAYCGFVGATVGITSFLLDEKGRKPSESHWDAVKAALSIGSSSWDNVKERRLTLQAPKKQVDLSRCTLASHVCQVR